MATCSIRLRFGGDLITVRLRFGTAGATSRRPRFLQSSPLWST